MIKISNGRTKIEVEMDLELKQKIDIISKAFNWTPKKFIEISLRKDVKYVQDSLERNTVDDLRLQYNTGINSEDLQKLILLSEVK